MSASGEGNPPPRSKLAAGAFVARIAAAHILSYPLILWVAATCMSLPILASEEALLEAAGQAQPSGPLQHWLAAELGLGAAEAATFEVVLRPLVVVTGLLFATAHVASVPWALGAKRSVMEGDPAHERRGRRVWLVATLGPTLLVTLVGLIGWARVLLI